MVVGAVSTFITLHLFTTGDEVKVRDLTGKNSMEAVQILNDTGLQLKISPQKRASDTIPMDRIMLQEPKPATKTKKGRSVQVYLSLGPQMVLVPDLVGQTARVANVTLEQRGLHEGKVIYVISPEKGVDEVLAQFPEPGNEVIGLHAVNLLVSNSAHDGRHFVMPDLIGKSITDVKQFFEDAGLPVGSLRPVRYPGIPPGTIVKQMPPAGYRIGQEVSIELSYSQPEASNGSESESQTQ